MNRFRIMHIVDSFGTGGTEAGIRTLLAGLDHAAFEQIVCTVAPLRQAGTETDVRVISVGRAGGGKQLLAGKLKRVFDRERPDIVHSRNWGTIEAIVAARLAGVRAVVHSEHGLESTTYQRQPWRRNMIRRVSFRWADKVFAVSRALRGYYAQQLRIDEQRMDVIPNGVDTERFRCRRDIGVDMRRRLGVSPETVVVGTVGRLDPVKDHRTLLRALDSLSALGLPIQLVIVGDGRERKALEGEIHSRPWLSGRTAFAGETSDIVSQLNSFDIFVLPSLAEGMSNALLEAMSVGVACIATRVGGNSELIEEGLSGLLFEPGDTQSLATLLKDLALDSPQRAHFGINARKRVEKCFGLGRMLHNYGRLYEGALSHRRTGSRVLNDWSTAQK